ncbi:OmpA family protein [Luteolibacter flavescens]|uniref:OmpA family protein n=1 Tax=Luteolibacter flavescens TaxID=1859460 RepID=A0ABT3FJ24_9BACT|nr:OmpA family protein [Luteolibacter flavescens]MCW1883569.1 OmpA family protein [Luteolibacter flavescens]
MKYRTPSPYIVSAIAAAAMITLPPAMMGQEPANPGSTPLKDRSEKVSPRSQPVEDKSRRASTESTPLEDEKREAGDRTQPAGKDAKPIRDDDFKANRRSTPERDTNEKASPDAEKTTDRSPQKASPDARKTTDRTSDKADPYSAKVRDSDAKKANSESRVTSPDQRRRTAPNENLPAPEIGTAESDVMKARDELAVAHDQRKLDIKGRADAGKMVQEILGKHSNLSRAEMNRSNQSAARRQARGDRRIAADFLRQRLKGEADLRQMPPFFRNAATDEDEKEIGRPAVPEPYFVHEGRRHAFYPSREDIPAVLLASGALGRVTVTSAGELQSPVFAAHIPAEYSQRDVWVVSYPVATDSTITSHDILFREGSTEFADGHAYDMVLALTDAMLDPGFAQTRFVIEGHASAEGTTSDNQLLSQLRAEAIVRELVRGGVSADRLIPVGYGESESHHPADAPEKLLSQDRRVVISRIDGPMD